MFDGAPSVEISLRHACGCTLRWLVWYLAPGEDAHRSIDLPCPVMEECPACERDGDCAARRDAVELRQAALELLAAQLESSRGPRPSYRRARSPRPRRASLLDG